MPNVTFYLLSSSQYTAEQFACRLVDKVWQKGQPVHLHLRDEQHCQTLDKLLWHWREDSFIPHCMTGTSSKIIPPVTLGCHQPNEGNRQLLINLADNPPDFYGDFDRVCEIVVQTPAFVEQSREKFRYYRQAGIQPQVHKMQ